MNMNKKMEFKKEDLVSIIIPVYNVEKYLYECIESVLLQSYKNIEIILIDDGSKDNSGNLCDELAKMDDRILVYHQENAGLSAARNKGIELSKGDYIYFLDSDDLIPKNTINYMVDLLIKENVDVVISSLKKFYKNKPDIENNASYSVVTAEAAIKKILLFQSPGHEACGKLYKKYLWNNIRFPEGRLYEDYLTTYRILADCKNVLFCNIPLYFYRTRENSIMNVNIGEKELSILNISQEVTDFISRNYPNLSKYAEYLQLVTYLKTMSRLLMVDDEYYINEQNRIKKYARSHWKYIFNNWVKTKDKIKLIALLINKRLFKCIYILGAKKNISDME